MLPADKPAAISRSAALAARSRRFIPAAVNSNFRKDEDFEPVYMARGAGGRLYDVDGNEYIDLSLSYGPAILGHSNEHLREAVIAQANRLYCTENNELESRAAEKIVEHVPCAELVRFACSGTDAVYNAVRVARAYTRRNLLVRFVGHYHGGTDELMGGIPDPKGGYAAVAGETMEDFFSQMTHTDGRAEHALHDTRMLHWNELDALDALFRAEGKNIAAVLMEPVMVNNGGCVPLPGYLEGVRALCTRYGALLIFDEVLTGFRMGLGGAQEHFGVIPDLATFAKALGGGLPVSAFCGRREIMDHITRTDVVAGGTYNGHPMAMAAVIATIEELERDGGAAFRRIRETGDTLRTGLEALSQRHKTPLLLQGFAGAWTYNFTDLMRIDSQRGARAIYSQRNGTFNRLLKKQRVLSTGRFCTSAAHTPADIELALAAADRAFAQMN
jgi:glutamate-1-semialdehyde 2,1-aminomutase